MTTSKELLYAILAMDSYNQGYDRGIEHDKTQIGDARKLERPSSIELKDWTDAGFYAAAYSTPYGTVISYRGTDFAGQVR